MSMSSSTVALVVGVYELQNLVKLSSQRILLAVGGAGCIHVWYQLKFCIIHFYLFFKNFIFRVSILSLASVSIASHFHFLFRVLAKYI